MELDFDKEIDAMLRTMPKSDADFAGKDTLNSHLDADEISAFAENALPEKAKERYVNHLANCDSCRKNLSELILLNAESEVEKVQTTAETATVVSTVPWYRKLFVFPNLAYTMGALVLAFTGLTTFVVLQNFNSSNSQIAKSDNASRITESAPVRDERMSANVSNTTASNSTVQSNSMSNNANISPQSSPETLSKNPAQNKSVNETDTPADSKTANELREETDSDLAKSSDKEMKADGAILKQPEEENRAVTTKPADVISSGTRPMPKATLAPPARKIEPLEKKREVAISTDGASSNDQIQVETTKKDAQNDEKAKSSRSVSSRQISGKTFNRKNDVWYDSAYRNQPTTNVRRGTSEYRNLDSGLRSIAGNLDGTIVVVWKEKAYRIQ